MIATSVRQRIRAASIVVAIVALAAALMTSIAPTPVAAAPELNTATARTVHERVSNLNMVTAAGIAEVHAAPARTVWDTLADCESGNWDTSSTPILGSARWDYGLTFSHGDIFEGGLNFHPRTWDSFRDAEMPGHAGHATREQEITVAERVLDAQGWRAWPVCSRKVGLR